MSKNFLFQRLEEFDPIAPVWHVTHKHTHAYVGEVRREGPNNFEVRRPSDSGFHGSHATRVQAARWLKDKRTSSVNFENDDEPEGDEVSES